MKRRAILALAAVLAAQSALADHTVPPNRPGAYAPRDACVKTPGARAFAASLHGAIARRDAGALAELAATDVQLDFGGGGGKALLRSQLTGAEGPALWRQLEEAVSLGCAMSTGDMVFPWLFAQNLGDVDPYDAYVVTGTAVSLYHSANMYTKPIGQLNWQLVIAQGDGLAPDADKHPLRRISVINSPLEGYVPTGKLRSVIGHRLVVRRQGGKWEITAFVAGD